MKPNLKPLLLAAAFFAASGVSHAGQRYGNPPPVVVSPDLTAPWMLQLRPGSIKKQRRRKNNRPKIIEVELNGEHRFEAVLDDRNTRQMVRVKGYAKPVKRMRLTVKDVYRGTKYRDTCVSDVILYSRLKKKPEIQGAR